MEGTAWQGILVASRSWDHQQGNRELSPMMANRVNLEVDFFPEPLETSNHSTASFKLWLPKQRTHSYHARLLTYRTMSNQNGHCFKLFTPLILIIFTLIIFTPFILWWLKKTSTESHLLRSPLETSELDCPNHISWPQVPIFPHSTSFWEHIYGTHMWSCEL